MTVFPGREKKLVKILTIAVLVLSAAAAESALAAQWRNHGGPRFDVQAPQRQRPGGYQRPPQRDYRAPQPQPERRPDGRLTEEERRNLHRDLDRANREIYKGR